MAAWLRRVGVSFFDLFDELAARFPEVSRPQIGKVVSQMTRLAPIMSRWENAYFNQKISRQDIPRDPSIPQAYRFSVDLTFKDADGNTIDYRTVILDSRTNLSRGELQLKSQAMADQLFRRRRGVIGSPPVAPWDSIDVTLLLVQRRT